MSYNPPTHGNVAVYNPNDKPLESLPRIYGFINGSFSSGDVVAQAISADGHPLGNHLCSSEAFAPGDLGLIEGRRKDRHENSYQRHYPDGYVCEYVWSEQKDNHAGLQEALRLNREFPDDEGGEVTLDGHIHNP